MAASKADFEMLRALEPIRAFPQTRLEELPLCIVESVARNQDLFRGRGTAGQLVYFVCGPRLSSMITAAEVVDFQQPYGALIRKLFSLRSGFWRGAPRKSREAGCP